MARYTLTIEFDDPAELAGLAAELARGMAAPPAPSNGAPQRHRDTETTTTPKERHDWPAATNAAGRGEERPARASGKGAKTPKSGGGLFAQLKEWDEADPDLAITKWVNGWAKRQGWEGRMVEWDDDQVRAAYDAAVKRVEALRQSAEFQAAHRGFNP